MTSKKGASHIDYKSLYQQRLRKDKPQQKRIDLLQDDLTKTIHQQQLLLHAISGMEKELIEKEEVINAQKDIVDAHLQTIHNHSRQLQQKARMITSLDQLVLTQQKELTQIKKNSRVWGC